jgi:adiponectin receptor
MKSRKTIATVHSPSHSKSNTAYSTTITTTTTTTNAAAAVHFGHSTHHNHQSHHHNSSSHADNATGKIQKNKCENAHTNHHAEGNHLLDHWKAVIHFHDLEEWRRDNQWILTGYRKLNNSYYACLQTLFFIHNETGNVLSHLLGGFFFVFLSIYTYLFVLVTGWHDQVIFAFFLLGAIGCLLLSGFFHLFCCHSLEVSLAWNKCDYLGIMFLIVGSCYPAIYYEFHCTPELQLLYLVLISSFGAASVPVLILDRFSTPKYRVLRTLLFVGMGLSGFFPMGHAIYLYSWDIAQYAGSLNLMLIMGSFYLVGALLYAIQVPERIFPGKFDIWLHSHQIFHICVLTAAILHYYGLVQSYNWHMAHPCHVEPFWHYNSNSSF